MNESVKNTKQKKTSTDWAQLKRTASNIGLMAAGAFISGVAMAAGQNMVERIASNPNSPNKNANGSVIPLQPRNVV